MRANRALFIERSRIIEAACAAWEAENVEAVVADLGEEVDFSVNAPPDAASFVGAGRGRAELVRRLEAYLAGIKVMYFEALLPITTRGDDALHCRAHFLYRHRIKPLHIEGTMRHVWRFRDDRVLRLDVYYDAPRMRAFYDLIETLEA